jgi:hypothetical protein
MILNNPRAKLTFVITAIAFLLMTVSCEKDPETVTEIVYVDTCYVNNNDTVVSSNDFQIGDTHEGGIIFYVDQTGDHGLVCSINNIGNSVPWGCQGTSIDGADGTILGSGNQNSIDINDGCSTDQIIHAAFEALIYGSAGFSGWYLPSKDELNEMYIHRFAIQESGDGFNGPFWSSSEVNANTAWMINFGNSGAASAIDKSIGFSVRAVRAF